MSVAASEIGVGTVIAETYEVTGLLGQGGMGAVWAAVHRRLPGKRVAVKVLLGTTTDPESLVRFKREAEIASRIGHPNIIEVLDFHTLPSGTPYMILEFLDGESLASRLRRGPMPLAAALEVARQIGSALHGAHRAGVVHRDLKPDNIFLVPSDSGGVVADRVKVLDFGISKIRGSSTLQTQESTLLGTPQYMSPEQAYGKNRAIDQRTDVWALGAIVYEMLAGAPAFFGETLAQVILSIVNDPAPSLSGRAGVPPEVARAVDRALEKDVAARWPDVASFVGALTGRPLQTLDRHAPVEPPPVDPTASTLAPSIGTQPRGEVVAQTPAQRSSVKLPRYAAVVVLCASVGAAALFSLRKPALDGKTLPPPSQKELFVDNQPRARIAPAPMPIAAALATAPPAAPPAAPPSALKTLPGKSGKPAKSNPEGIAIETAEGRHPSEEVPPEVKGDLDEARGLLAKGDVDGALHVARRTLTVKQTSAAFALITTAYCQSGDLGNAKASFSSVTGADRGRVKAVCKRHDIALP